MPRLHNPRPLLAALIGATALSGLAMLAPTPAQAQSTLRIKPPSFPVSGSVGSQSPPGDAASQRKEQRRQADLVEAVFDRIRDFVPNPRSFAADNDAGQTEAMKALEAFREEMSAAITAELISMAGDPTNTYATRTAKAADRHADATARTVSSIDLTRFRNSTGRDDTAIAQYFLMVYRAEQMRQLARLFPQSQSVRSANEVVVAAMNELGSLDSVIAGRQEAQAARIAAMRLYPPARRDAAAEADFANAWKSSVWTQGEFAGSDVLKVHLLSSGWTVRRNPITGVILSRDQRADLAVRRKDGKCFSYVIELEQKHQGGGSFGGTYMASGRDLEMLCSNIGG